MAGKAVAKKEDAALAAWGEYDGPTGFEGTDKSELAIPFINLLQSNSEVVEDGDASAGQLYNNVMETAHDELRIIPCARQKVFVEWVPVDDGGGLVGIHDPNSQFVKDALKANDNNAIGMKVADGKHELVETIYLYALVLDDDGGYGQAVIAFTSTKLKKYRQFFTKATSQMQELEDGRKIKLPLWAHRWVLSSEQEVSKKGKKFQNFNLAFDGENARECRYTPADQIFQDAAAFHEMVTSGMAKADLSQASNETGSSDGDEEIPF